MGLDINAYDYLYKVECSEEDCSLYHAKFYADQPFVERLDGIVSGCYIPGSNFGFRAGSYSGYNAWRELLCGFAQGRSYGEFRMNPSGPFQELLNFSDCEGGIGPKVSARLAEDFEKFETRVTPLLDQWDAVTYRRFAIAFRLAAAGGAVRFS